jgi:hypothetical protein
VCRDGTIFSAAFLDFPMRGTYDHLMLVRLSSVVAILLAGATWVQAQSLAEVAKAEEARRKAVTAPSKVYTNDNLRADFTRPTPPADPNAAAPAATATADPDAPAAADTPAEATAAEAPATAGGPARDQAYWSGRITEARAQLERTRVFATAIQNRVDMLWFDFVNRDDPAQRAVIERNHQEALAELTRLRREIEEQTKAVAAIEEEARRAGVPPGWLRPQA